MNRVSVQVHLPVLDPLPVISRKPSENSNNSSTKRTLSYWEQVERPVRKCTVCKQPGHNKNSLNCHIKLQQLQAASQPPVNNKKRSPDPFVDPLPSLCNTVPQPTTPPTALSIIDTTPSITLTIRSPSTGRTQREIDFQLSGALPTLHMDENANEQPKFYINPAALDILDDEETPEATERRLHVATLIADTEEALLVIDKGPLNPEWPEVVIAEYEKSKAAWRSKNKIPAGSTYCKAVGLPSWPVNY